MSIDFAALASAVVSGVSDVRACLVVSRDGLALGAFPATDEERVLAVWSRVAALGEVERGFVGLRDEVWVFCRRGPYAALAVGHPTSRPGLILDHLDQMLLAAEEARVRKEPFRAPDREAPIVEIPRGPRTPLHAPSPKEDAPPAERRGATVSAWVQRLQAEVSTASAARRDEPPVSPSPPPELEEAPDEVAEPEPGWVIDPVVLSREFHALLDPNDDEDR